MKVLFLDPPYSRYFDSLSVALQTQFGATCMYYDPFLMNYMYFPKTNRFRSQFKYCGQEFKKNVGIISELAQKTRSLSFPNENSVVWSRALRRFVTQLAGIITFEKIDIFILYNDLRWHHAIAIEVFKHFQIRYFVFERGPIREKTVSCDSLGVNARSDFFINYHNRINSQKQLSLDKTYEAQANLKKYFLLHLSHRFIARYMWGVPKIYQKDNELLSYGLRWMKGIVNTDSPSKLNLTVPDNAYFVPLQLEHDSQIMFSSPIKKNQEFIDFVLKLAAKNNIEVIFKRHPHDNKNYDFYGNLCLDHPVDDILSLVNGIITINSTVGFEALCKELPVLCVGETFYSLDEFVYKLDDVDAFFSAKKSKTEKAEMLRILSNSYMFPGDVYHYDKDDITIIARHIVSYVR